MNVKTTVYHIQYQEDVDGLWHSKDTMNSLGAAESLLKKYAHNTTFHAWRIKTQTIEDLVLKTIITKKQLNRENLVKILHYDNTFIEGCKAWHLEFVEFCSGDIYHGRCKFITIDDSAIIQFRNIEIDGDWLKCQTDRGNCIRFHVCKKIDLKSI